MPEYSIHFDLDIMACMPVKVNIDTSRLLEQPLHFVQSGVEPYKIARHAAFPDVGEGAQLVLVAEDDVVLPAGEERRVDVDQVDALARKLAHHVQVVAPEQAVGLQFRMAECDAVDHLERQHDLREELAEALATVPAQRLLFDRHAAEARRRPPELLLLRQRVRPLVSLHRLRRREEITLVWAFRRRGSRFAVLRLSGHADPCCLRW